MCAQMDAKLGRAQGESEALITYVKDRPGHDRRYAIDATKLNMAKRKMNNKISKTISFSLLLVL